VDIPVHLLRFTQVSDLRKKSKANSALVSAQRDRNVVPPWSLCCEINEGGHCRVVPRPAGSLSLAIITSLRFLAADGALRGRKKSRSTARHSGFTFG
jgi:hypothetical protein